MKRQSRAHEGSAKGAGGAKSPPTTDSEMAAFKKLTGKLLKVAPKELEAERKQYEREKKTQLKDG